MVAVKELQGNCIHHAKLCIKGQIVTQLETTERDLNLGDVEILNPLQIGCAWYFGTKSQYNCISPVLNLRLHYKRHNWAISLYSVDITETNQRFNLVFTSHYP